MHDSQQFLQSFIFGNKCVNFRFLVSTCCGTVLQVGLSKFHTCKNYCKNEF